MISKGHIYFVSGLVIIWSIVPVWVTTILYCIMCILLALKFWRVSKATFVLATVAGTIALMCPSLYGATVENIKIYQQVVWSLHILQTASLICFGLSIIVLLSLAGNIEYKIQARVQDYITVPDSLIGITNASYRESIVQGAVQASANTDVAPKVPTYIGIEDALSWATRAETRENVIKLFTRVVEDDIDETDNK